MGSLNRQFGRRKARYNRKVEKEAKARQQLADRLAQFNAVKLERTAKSPRYPTAGMAMIRAKNGVGRPPAVIRARREKKLHELTGVDPAFS